jgi:hypothetical protein
MTGVDTLKVAKKFEAGGFSKKQAATAAEVLADLLDERSSKDAVREAIEIAMLALDQRRQADTAAIRADIAAQGEVIGRLEEVVGRQGEAIGRLEERVSRQGEAIGRQGEAIGRLEEVVGRLEGLLVKVLEGQAVLHQNDMELKRRLDER